MLLLMGICLGTLAYSETIFIQYDENCMDRYEYRYNGAGHGHIAYHIRKNDREKVILEVGIESKVIRPDRPTNVKTCRQVAINEKLVRGINNGDVQVYFVRRMEGGYNVSPVGIATYTQISPTFVGFTSVDHKFVYNFAQPAGDQNLALNNSESQVFYRGAMSHNCPRKYQFERLKKRAGRSYAEMVVIPEIGIIEEKIGFNKTDADNNRLVLVAINGVPVDQYIGDFCGQQSFDNAYSGTFYSTRRYATGSPSSNGGSIVDLENGKRPSTSTPTKRPNGNDANGNNGNSTVQNDGNYQFKCNNIYKDIDKNLYYDRSTGQPANTSCGGVTYRNGQRAAQGTVVVNEPPANPSTGGVTVPDSAPATNNGGVAATGDARPGPCGEFSGNGYHIVQNNETLYGISQLYGLSLRDLKNWNALNSNLIKPCMKLYVRPRGSNSPNAMPGADGDVLVSKGENSGYHVVQPNETLYGIAKKYGYTTAKIRQMNGLGPNDLIFVNQRLKTSDCNCPSPAVANNNRPSPSNIPVAAEFVADKSIPAEFNSDGKRKVHVVKDDETIYSIARAYNMTASRLRQINQLEENEIIIPYQRLYVE